MADDSKTSNDHGDQFDHSLKLPEELKIQHNNSQPPDRAAAADLIRQKVDAALEGRERVEPDFSAEVEEITAQAKAEPQLSKHQQFIYELSQSGRPLRDINAAWHEYYGGLSDAEKHQVWREFNEAHLQASKFLKAQPAGGGPIILTRRKTSPKRRTRQVSSLEKAAFGHGKKLAKRAAATIPERHRQPLKSLAFGLSIGCLVIFIFLFTFFNERFIAPFIQPSRTVNSAQVITATTAVSTKPEILVPKINLEVPVVYWVTSTDEKAVQDGLDNGVVHYADTAQPGQNGNVAIVGHSASNIFNKGRYKFAFSLLRRLDIGDTFYLQKSGVRYTYQIYKKQVVKPSDVNVLAPDPNNPAIATLITCDPPGTNSNRLVVVGKQIDPDPGKNAKQTTDNQQATSQTKNLPGNSKSLWSRIVKWFTGSQ